MLGKATCVVGVPNKNRRAARNSGSKWRLLSANHTLKQGQFRVK